MQPNNCLSMIDIMLHLFVAEENTKRKMQKSISDKIEILTAHTHTQAPIVKHHRVGVYISLLYFPALLLIVIYE